MLRGLWSGVLKFLTNTENACSTVNHPTVIPNAMNCFPGLPSDESLIDLELVRIFSCNEGCDVVTLVATKLTASPPSSNYGNKFPLKHLSEYAFSLIYWQFNGIWQGADTPPSSLETRFCMRKAFCVIKNRIEEYDSASNMLACIRFVCALSDHSHV